MEGFWKFLTWACLAWYSTITLVVAIKGVTDIRDMLRNLARGHRGGDSAPRPQS